MTTKLISATLALSLSLVAAPALAQDVGATVTGNDGNPIGTVIANDAGTVTIDTGMHQVPLASDSFAKGDSGWTLNTTKADLDATMTEMMEQQAAALEAALVVGAPVVSADAQPLGMVEEFMDENVILADGETKMTLPKDLFALDANGAVMVLANYDAIMAALEAASS